MKLARYLIIFSIIFLMSVKAYSAVFSFEDEPNTGTALLPAGTMFKAILQDTVDTGFSKIGDPVHLLLVSDITVGKSICIPKNSIFFGEVVELAKARQGRDGYFRIALHTLIFPDGWRTDVSARIMDRNNTDVIGGEVTERTEYRKVRHNIEGIGMVVKLVKAGPREMGEERRLSAGRELFIVLDRDLEVKYLEKF